MSKVCKQLVTGFPQQHTANCTSWTKSSETILVDTGVPQGCVLGPLLFMTHDFCANMNHIIKSASDFNNDAN